MTRIAIIGAGLSGLVLARELAGCGEVSVFEKARGVGGRMSTRYAEPFYFDHGAQCFTARTQAFRHFLEPYTAAGVVAEWKGKVINLEIGKKESKRLWFEPHLVASPNMNSLCKVLAEGVQVQSQCEVAPLAEKTTQGWQLLDKEGKSLGHFDWVISTAPPAQTVRLFSPHLQEDAPLRHVALKGCYALMLGFNKAWDKQWIAAKVRNNPIKWISVNSSKPGRNKDVTCLVAHSRNSWAEAHIDDDMAQAQAFLLEQFRLVTGIDAATADFVACHRWRYAIVEETHKTGSYFDPQQGLAATSDWCQTSRIEEVWQHAHILAHNIIENHKNR